MATTQAPARRRTLRSRRVAVLVLAIPLAFLLIFAAGVAAILTTIERPTAAPPDRLRLVQVASGYGALTAAVPLGEGLLLASQDGLVHLLGRQRPVLDISDLVEVSAEGGLIGMALHPAFPDNRRLFVTYTAEGGNSVVASFELDADLLGAAGTEQRILELAQPDPVHNGGRLAFGPDGYLYVSLGDGTLERDAHGNGQNLETLFSSVLRLDVAVDPYRVPADNPFVDGGGAAEIWSYGLRNPWGISFDRATGDLWIADVGSSVAEEVNVQRAGASGLNFGWSMAEGPECAPWARDCDLSRFTSPFYSYRWGAGMCAIVGGFVYRGSAVPDLFGRYVFGDYCAGRIWSLDATAGGERRHEIDSGFYLTAFAEDHDGEIYALTSDGQVLRIVH